MDFRLDLDECVLDLAGISILDLCEIYMGFEEAKWLCKQQLLGNSQLW